MGRKKTISYLKDSPKRNTKILELIHFDGPINIKYLRGADYFVTFIDHGSRKIWYFLIKTKFKF